MALPEVFYSGLASLAGYLGQGRTESPYSPPLLVTAVIAFRPQYSLVGIQYLQRTGCSVFNMFLAPWDIIRFRDMQSSGVLITRWTRRA